MLAGNTAHRDILSALKHSEKIDVVLGRNSGNFVLPPDDRALLLEACFGYNQCTASLIHHYRPGANQFNYTIKNHYLVHFGLVGQYMNPALASCHDGEDLMRVVKRICYACSGGLSPAVAIRKAIDKYVRGLSMAIGGCCD